MPKLIDADALVAKLMGRIYPASMSQPEFTQGVKAGFRIVEREAESMPDASEPLLLDAARTMQRLEDRNTDLRARIKELEEALEKVSDTLDDLHRSYGHPLSCSDAIDAAVSLAAETLKGGQDA